MLGFEKLLIGKVRKVVENILGAERVLDVHAELSSNDDGEPIAWFRIVYSGDAELSVAEMQRIKESILVEREANSPFPIVSFLEERDLAAQ